MISCALAFAAAIMGDGVAAKRPKNRVNRDEMVGNEIGYVDRAIFFSVFFPFLQTDNQL
jgi:hypothetical protein